jgi:predicted GNAT family N-acyltransferase
MHPQLHITSITHGSEAYQQMLQLRTEVLLQPIGIDPSFIKPVQEQEDILIGAFEKDRLVGCCVLTRISQHVVQLRQMAVAKELQGKRIGNAILAYAERVAQEQGFQTLMLHARNAVVPFYQKSGYIITGDPFEEVGIKHYKMEKRL